MFLEIKFCMYWFIFLINLGVLFNYLYFKTILFLLLLLNNEILEFTFDNIFCLINLEILVFSFFLLIIFWIILPLILSSIIIPGLYCFEFHNFLKNLIYFFVSCRIYFFHLSQLFEEILLYSNLNSSSLVVLFSPIINDFIQAKFWFHFLIFNFIICCIATWKTKFLIIFSLIFFKNGVLLLLFLEARQILNNYYYVK